MHFLVNRGAKLRQLDYWQATAEENANGDAIHAFYEISGLRFDSHERFVKHVLFGRWLHMPVVDLR